MRGIEWTRSRMLGWELLHMIVPRRWPEGIWRPIKSNVSTVVIGGIVVCYSEPIGIGTAFFRCSEKRRQRLNLKIRKEG